MTNEDFAGRFKDMSHAIDERMPASCRFLLLVVDSESTLQAVSCNLEQDRLIKVLESFLAKWKAQK